MVKVEVRYLTTQISDYETFMEMHQSFAYIHEDETFLERNPVIKDYESFKEHAQNEEIFVAMSEGQVIGYAIGYGYTEGVCKIHEIYVKPEARRRGVGRKFVEQIKQVAKNEGFRKIQLNSVSMATDNFWSSCNFRPLNYSALYEFYF